MGKFISKIAPTVNSGQSLQAANTKVSRKIVYRRLQGARLYQKREVTPLTDFVSNFWGVAFFAAVIYILHRRGTLEEYLPKINEDKPFELEQSLYEKVRDGFLKKKENDNEKGKNG